MSARASTVSGVRLCISNSLWLQVGCKVSGGQSLALSVQNGSGKGNGRGNGRGVAIMVELLGLYGCLVFFVAVQSLISKWCAKE